MCEIGSVSNLPHPPPDRGASLAALGGASCSAGYCSRTVTVDMAKVAQLVGARLLNHARLNDRSTKLLWPCKILTGMLNLLCIMKMDKLSI